MVRNRVKRRLRAQVAPLLDDVPSGTDLVIRANPVAAQANSADMGKVLRRLVTELTGGAA